MNAQPNATPPHRPNNLASRIRHLQRDIADLSRAAERQSASLRFAHKNIRSLGVAVVETSIVGAYVGMQTWPCVPLEAVLRRYGLPFNIVCPLDQNWSLLSDQKPRTAIKFKTNDWRATLAYQVIFGRLNIDHLMVYRLPDRANGNRVFLFVARSVRKLNVSKESLESGLYGSKTVDDDFSEAELRILQAIGDATPEEPPQVSLEGQNALPPDDEDIKRLVSNFTLTVAWLDSVQEAALARFWGMPQTLPDGSVGLPVKLKRTISKKRNEWLSYPQSQVDPYKFTLVKNFKGRILSIRVSCFRSGAIELKLTHISDSANLERVVKKCQSITGPFGLRVRQACLAILGGALRREDVAKRLELPDDELYLHRVYNQAFDIVADPDLAA